MPIPDFQSIMLPLLELAADGKTYYIHDEVEKLADRFNLSEDEKSKLLSSGQQPIFYNRVGWARTYLKKADLFPFGSNTPPLAAEARVRGLPRG